MPTFFALRSPFGFQTTNYRIRYEIIQGQLILLLFHIKMLSQQQEGMVQQSISIHILIHPNIK